MTIERLCKNCEYFDGGGLRLDGSWRESEGDCLNRLSPRFQTNQNWTCDKFYPDTSRECGDSNE